MGRLAVFHAAIRVDGTEACVIEHEVERLVRAILEKVPEHEGAMSSQFLLDKSPSRRRKVEGGYLPSVGGESPGVVS